MNKIFTFLILAVLASTALFSQNKPGIIEFTPVPSEIDLNNVFPKYYYYSITTNCDFEFLGWFSPEKWQEWFNKTEQNHSKFQAIIASPTRLDSSKIEVAWGKECR